MLKGRTLKIFGLRRREIRGGQRKLCEEELQKLQSSLSIIKDEIKKDELDSVVTHMMEKRNTNKFFKRIPTKFWQDNAKKRVHLEGLGIDGRIILKYTIKKDEKAWTAFVRFGIRPVVCSCENGDETFSSIHCGAFHNSPKTCQILEKGCAPWYMLFKTVIKFSPSIPSIRAYATFCVTARSIIY